LTGAVKQGVSRSPLEQRGLRNRKTASNKLTESYKNKIVLIPFITCKHSTVICYTKKMFNTHNESIKPGLSFTRQSSKAAIHPFAIS